MQYPRAHMRAIVLVTLIAFLSISKASSDEPAQGKQVEMELKPTDDSAIPYLLYLPKNFTSKDAKWPLIFFLHGRGESRGPLSVVKKWGPPRLVENGADLPYVIVSPQCPNEESWAQPHQQKQLTRLLDHIIRQYKIDEDRIYLTGLSMGGFGSWRLAADQPERFAAVIPICGGGNREDADKLKNIPIWVFHGTEDTAVPLDSSVEMVEAIKKAGGTNIRFTTLEGIGHNSWEAAYASPDVYQWLDTQRASKNRGRARQ
jgi:predicted peptidase